MAYGISSKGNASSTLVTVGIVGAVFAVLGIFALSKLMPRFQRPVDYTPRFLGIGPHAYGHPFDVRLLRKTFGPSFRGQGVVQFFPDHLIVDGHREINSYVQLGVFLVLTAVPMLLIGVGLSTVLAAIIAIAIGRKKIVQAIPYHAIRSITLDGNAVTIECAGLSPAKIVFYVASPDGERLQGEIDPRFAPILRRAA